MKGILVFMLNLYGKFKRTWHALMGRSEKDVFDDQVVSGRAWAAYCDSLKAAGNTLIFGNAPMDPRNQAEGIRYLSRLSRAGLEAFLEFNDPLFPKLRNTVDDTIKMGADNPDNFYQNAQIDGRYDYRVWGKRNSVHYLGFFTQDGSYGSTGGLAPCDALEDEQMVFEADGSFEVTLSKEGKGKNCLRITNESSLFMVRQTFLDQENEQAAEVNIECLNGPARPDHLDAAQLTKGLDMAGLFVTGAASLFAKWSNDFQSHVNELPLFDPAVSNAAGGDKNIAYYHSYWKLGPDQALLIRAKPPICRYWNFQLNNHWMESLDYRHFRIHINKHTAIKEADGSVLLVVSAKDPNHPNWIETCGLNQGTMLWRWMHAEDHPQPSCELVQLESWINEKDV